MKRETSIFALLPLSIALAILSNLFVYYAFSLAYDRPEYNEVCPFEEMQKTGLTEAECKAEGGEWFLETSVERPNSNISRNDELLSNSHCDFSRKCSEAFQELQDDYSSKLFVVFLISGIILLVLSRLEKITKVLSYGFAYGGVLSVVIAGFNAWAHAGELFRLLLIGVAIALLVWMGLKKFSND